MSDRHEKRFETIRDGHGKPRKMGTLRIHTPIYQPNDPRIRQDLDRGAGVGVNLSGLTDAERAEWLAKNKKDLLSGGLRRQHTEIIDAANEEMRQPLERFKPEDEEDAE